MTNVNDTSPLVTVSGQPINCVLCDCNGQSSVCDSHTGENERSVREENDVIKFFVGIGDCSCFPNYAGTHCRECSSVAEKRSDSGDVCYFLLEVNEKVQ